MMYSITARALQDVLVDLQDKYPDLSIMELIITAIEIDLDYEATISDLLTTTDIALLNALHCLAKPLQYNPPLATTTPHVYRD